jgi:hypothetical protein
MLRKANFFKWRTTTLTDTGVYDSSIYSTTINCQFCLEFFLTPASFPPVNITEVELSLLKISVLKSWDQFLSKWIDYYPISVSWQSNKTHLHWFFPLKNHLWKLARMMSNEKWWWDVILCDNRWWPNNKSRMYVLESTGMKFRPCTWKPCEWCSQGYDHTHSYLSVLVWLDLT